MENPKPSIVHVVDNDEAVRDSTCILLELHGIEVRTYASAQEFLLATPEQHNGCLLLDLHMPAMDGLELLELLQALRFRLPVVALTGSTDPTLKERAICAGAVAVLCKPVPQEMLLKSLLRAVVNADFRLP